ncbi:MAG: PEP/pyruvate-binding domain-containing protein [Myxococcales bacterium]|nr:PEP/pyruvate-binding domain-containing protein [Polyangiaceae bacterium]MDW8251861.1 PEP/pyruvate-binding domain-containing protein [Myxococcales bacterium]
MRLFPLLLVALHSLATVFSCSAAGPVSVLGSATAPVPNSVPLRRDGDFAPAIPGPEVWDALAFRPATSILAGTEVVKVILDRSDGSLYFLQSERWPVHYYFARRFLSRPGDPVGDERAFNRREYHTPERRFILGTVSRYPGEVWAFELYAGDELDIEETARAFAQIRQAVFFGDRLRYRPVPSAHEQDPRTRVLMPVIESHDLFGRITYQPLELGEAFGYLRILPTAQDFDPTRLRPFDIVVLGSLPEDIPVVSGVITDELQAPLGHINVLCHNRKTPNMALRGASKRPEVVALEGQLVRLRVDAQGYTLSLASQKDAEHSWEQRRPKTPQTPRRDDAEVGLPALAQLTLEDIPRVGAKAAQLGLVTRLAQGRFRVPRGFALPMAAYARFLAAHGLDRRIQDMLADPTFQQDASVRAQQLAALREVMEKAEVPNDILQPLRARIKELLPPGKVRLRSSTNAEDLPGFNGAGLYRSARVDPDDPVDVARGLRKVWSSVWLAGAHEERTWYRIDSSTVGMAILVQESIDDDVINGVAITENPFSQGQPGYFVNAQVSGGSVTGARGNEIPEQLLIYTFEDGQGVERLSNSSLNGGKPLLRPEDIKRLSSALEILHIGFTGDHHGMTGRAVDVEFLFAGPARDVVIVQARPYQVEWTRERRWLDDQGRVLAPRAR